MLSLPTTRYAARTPGDDALVPDSRDGSIGWLHSIEAGSAVDGPGMRLVLFTSGCLLRCQFCHNPDTWHRSSGTSVSADDLFAHIKTYAGFLRACRGGVTFSGGEPLVQLPFVMRVLARVKEELGLHTAVQTAAFLGDRVTDAHLDLVDLWMVDLKSAIPEQYKLVTSVDAAPSQRFIRRLAEQGRPFWGTYVLVPGLTDSESQIDALGQLLAPLKSMQRLELRPFHQLGKHKWESLKVAYPLEGTLPPTPDIVERVRSHLAAQGLPVIVA